MALESTVTRETFAGNGTTTKFDFSFKVWETSEILVYRSVSSTKEEDCTSECTITLNEGSEPGGTVVFNTAPVSGVTIAIVRNMPFIQEDRYINGSRFDPHEIEDRFDQDCAERQQLREGLSRAVVVPYTDSRTVEEYTDDFWAAVAGTEANMKTAGEYADKSTAEADRAKSEADRAESEADRAASEADRSASEADRAADERVKAAELATLGSYVQNLEATWALDKDYAAGSEITLPIPYFPGRTMLHVSYEGVELYKGAQYEEVGEDKDEPSFAIQTLINLTSGSVIHVWVVMSNVSKYATDLIQAMKDSYEVIWKAEQSAAESAENAYEERVKAGQIVTLGTLAENLEATWELEKDYAEGEEIGIPVPYFPGRSMLHVSYEGVELYKGAQYEETSMDKDEPTFSIQTLINLTQGSVMHVWVVMSNVVRYAQQLLEQAEECRDESCACAEDSCACAAEAKKSQEQAASAASDAGDAADRADDAALDAENAAAAAKKAALCAYIYRRGRRLAAVVDEEYLSAIPNGFWVINPEIVLPATIQHPLTPVQDEIPDYCEGFFVFAPAFTDATPCPPYPDTSGNGGDGGNGGGTTSTSKMLMPCGARARYSTAP